MALTKKLEDIANAIREKQGKERYEYGEPPIIDYEEKTGMVTKTLTKKVGSSNINLETGQANSVYNNGLNEMRTVTFDEMPANTPVHIKLWYGTESTNYDWVVVNNGSISSTPQSYSDWTVRYGGNAASSKGAATKVEFDWSNDTNTFTFGLRSDSSAQYYGYYAELSVEYEEEDVIQIPIYGEPPIVEDNSLTLAQMPDEIRNLTVKVEASLPVQIKEITNNNDYTLNANQMYGYNEYKWSVPYPNTLSFENKAPTGNCMAIAFNDRYCGFIYGKGSAQNNLAWVDLEAGTAHIEEIICNYNSTSTNYTTYPSTYFRVDDKYVCVLFIYKNNSSYYYLHSALIECPEDGSKAPKITLTTGIGTVYSAPGTNTPISSEANSSQMSYCYFDDDTKNLFIIFNKTISVYALTQENIETNNAFYSTWSGTIPVDSVIGDLFYHSIIKIDNGKYNLRSIGYDKSNSKLCNREVETVFTYENNTCTFSDTIYTQAEPNIDEISVPSERNYAIHRDVIGQTADGHMMIAQVNSRVQVTDSHNLPSNLNNQSENYTLAKISVGVMDNDGFVTTKGVVLDLSLYRDVAHGCYIKPITNGIFAAVGVYRVLTFKYNPDAENRLELIDTYSFMDFPADYSLTPTVMPIYSDLDNYTLYIEHPQHTGASYTNVFRKLIHFSDKGLIRAVDIDTTAYNDHTIPDAPNVVKNKGASDTARFRVASVTTNNPYMRIKTFLGRHHSVKMLNNKVIFFEIGSNLQLCGISQLEKVDDVFSGTGTMQVIPIEDIPAGGTGQAYVI